MAERVQSIHSSLAINQFCQSSHVINEVSRSNGGKEISNVTSERVELEGFQNDLPELLHLLHVAERPSVKEIIQADIELILSEIESLEDICKNQFETNISWSRVAALKHSKSKYKKQKTSDSYLTSNRLLPPG